MTRYLVTHRTEYGYDDAVTASYGLAVLLPRQVPGRQRVDAQVVIEPAPVDQREHTDVYGNRALYFSVLTEHQRLVVTATSRVEVEPAALVLDGPAWEDVREALRTSVEADVVDAVEFVLASPLVGVSEAVAAYAAPSFPPGRPVVAGAIDLMHRINAEFEYEPGTTTVSTKLDEVLRLRSGVCQDFAHLFVGCVRSLGLAARYVSGYLETDPPPGETKLTGSDASHAWVSVWVPELGWLDADPTNDQVPPQRHITVAWGRDYFDVTPVRGVVIGPAASQWLTVGVDVTSVDDR